MQVENWLTDYYTSTPTIGSGPKCDLDKPRSGRRSPRTPKLRRSRRSATTTSSSSTRYSGAPPSGLFTGWYPNCLNIPQGIHVPHGGYTSGLHHDSVVRPRYDRAYVYALAASYEWAQIVLGWVSGGFAARVKSYNPSSSDAADGLYQPATATMPARQEDVELRCSPSAATCTGDIAGGPWSAGSPYTTKGSYLSGYFTSTPPAP